VSLQNTGSGDGSRQYARALLRLWAALLNMLSSLFEAVGSFFDVVRSLLEAAGLGIRKSAKEIGNVIAALLREKLISWLSRMRRARGIPDLNHDRGVENQAIFESEGINPSSTSLQIAMRQADLARDTAERFQLEAADRIKNALLAAEKADDAARKHRAMRWERPPVGPLIFEDTGIIYNGDLSRGEAYGYGVFEHSTSTVYRGQVRGNRKSGFGVCSQGGQANYEGEFESHQRHGLGRLRTSTYDYVGQFVRDEIREYGILTRTAPQAEWEKHLGFFERAEANGYGVRHFANGHVHSGEFKNDIPHGFGIRTLGGTIIQAGRWEGEECHKL
jgi:hypothetical protein